MTIKVKNLNKTFDDKKVIDDVSFDVRDGEVLAIVGFSGSGKSTILKLICNLIKPDSGLIETSIGDVAMVFQYSALFDSLNVFNNIAFALKERKEFRKKFNQKQLEEIVAQKLKMVGLEGIERKYPSELSGGMQKRVSFARAIVTEPKTILYDEPTSGLDPISSTLIEDYIVRLKEETQAASIVVTHQMSTIQRTADRIIMLYQGRIVFEGTPEEMLSTTNEYASQFVSASLEGPMQMLAEWSFFDIIIKWEGHKGRINEIFIIV